MKRFIGVVLTLLFAFSALSICILAQEREQVDNEVINVIKLLGIANGDENGDMNYHGSVTRAQFVKMAVCASPSKDTAINTNLNVSLFYDVKNSYWGAGYISVAINNGLVNGYLDGTFKPDNQVTLEEAVTVVLKLLGYTSADLSGPYPSPQLEKYKSLELNKNISAVRGQHLTRLECMQLLYNALSTKTKQGNVYCSTLGYGINNEGKIDYTALLEEKTDGPIIVTNVAAWKNLIPFNITKNTSVILDGQSITAKDIKVNDILYYSTTLKFITVYRKTATGVVTAITSSNNSPSAITLTNGKTYTLATNAVKEKFSSTGIYGKKDSFVTLLLGRNNEVIQAIDGSAEYINDNTDNAEYLDMLNATISTPFVITDDSWIVKIPFDITSASLYINGAAATKEQVKINDAVYYSEPFKSIWVFRDEVSGIIAATSPSTVTIGSKTYTIVTESAKYKVSDYGEFGEDDYVKLVLGKNKEVVDILKAKLSNINSNYNSNDDEYLDMINKTLSKPFLISSDNITSWKSIVPFDLTSGTIYFNGIKTSQDDVKVNDVIYYSETFELVWIFRETASGVLNMVTGNSLNVSGKSYTLATDSAKFKVSAYGEFEENDYITLLLGKDKEVVDIVKATIDDIGDKDNDSTYSEIVSATLEGPYVVDANAELTKLPFDIEKAEIFKGSGKISSDQIKQYDVYYYSELLSTVWIYRDTATGTIEAITPMITPTSVVVSGRTYSLETSQAAYDLSSFGTFHVGDDVTLLLGKDGVAAVMSPNAVSETIYGIITDKGTKSFYKKDGSAYTADYVTVTDTFCMARTYEYDNKYLKIGDIVRVTYDNSLNISVIPASSNTKGAAALLKEAIYKGKLTNDCQIIDTYNGMVKKIYPSRLKGLNIDIDDFTFGNGIVLLHSFDDDGNIEKLILNNFTGDLFDYGVASTYSNGTVKYMIDGSEITYMGENTFDGPVRIYNSDLYSLPGYIDVDVLTKNCAYDEDQNEYKLSSDVKVYIRDGVTFKYAEMDDVLDGNYIFKAYYDKSQNRGGRIRVIIAQRSV